MMIVNVKTTTYGALYTVSALDCRYVGGVRVWTQKDVA